jgi:apolipoprotein N-acyltransferase
LRAAGFDTQARRQAINGLAMRIGGIADCLANLRGWRRSLAAIGFGGLASLSAPPFYLVPLLWIAFPGYYWMLGAARSGGAAFLTGWTFGLGFFAPGLYWVSWALTVDLSRFFWLMPVAIVGLPALLAVFPGLAALAFIWLRRRGWGGPLAFAALWGLGEWLRGHVLTGFPWNLIGYAWVGWLPVLQGSAVIGIYGLGLLTVAAAVLPAALSSHGRKGLTAAGAGVACMGLIALWGYLRLADNPTVLVPETVLRLVQPNIEQTEKWRDDLRAAHFERQLALSRRPGLDEVRAVVWPETAVPFTLPQNRYALQRLGEVAPPDGLVIVGALRASESGTDPAQVWNSVFAIDGDGRVVETYDKAHLVPFGEYVPFRDLLPVDKITAGSLDFSAGPGARTLDLAGLPPVGPLICYEIIFPGAVTAPDAARPQWLLNPTNDAWYGHTAGPYQHFAIARTRAVEEGLPLVRVANTGISGVVDAYGRVTARLGLGDAGILDAALPAAAVPTPYARWGDLCFWILVLLGLAGGRAIASNEAPVWLSQ